MALAGWDTQPGPLRDWSRSCGSPRPRRWTFARCSDLVTDSMSALGLGVEDMAGYLIWPYRPLTRPHHGGNADGGVYRVRQCRTDGRWI